MRPIDGQITNFRLTISLKLRLLLLLLLLESKFYRYVDHTTFIVIEQANGIFQTIFIVRLAIDIASPYHFVSTDIPFIIISSVPFLALPVLRE